MDGGDGDLDRCRKRESVRRKEDETREEKGFGEREKGKTHLVLFRKFLTNDIACSLNDGSTDLDFGGKSSEEQSKSEQVVLDFRRRDRSRSPSVKK